MIKTTSLPFLVYHGNYVSINTWNINVYNYDHVQFLHTTVYPYVDLDEQEFLLREIVTYDKLSGVVVETPYEVWKHFQDKLDTWRTIWNTNKKN